MMPKKPTLPGDVASTTKTRSTPTVTGPGQQLSAGPTKPVPRPPRSTKVNPIAAKHGLKYGQSLTMKEGTGPSAYAVAEAARRPSALSPEVLAKAKGMKKGGSVGSASKRADGIASKGKTKGKIC